LDNKTRRCLKCKSLIKITKEEFTLKWGVKKSIEKSTDSEKKKFEQEEMKEEQHQLVILKKTMKQMKNMKTLKIRFY